MTRTFGNAGQMEVYRVLNLRNVRPVPVFRLSDGAAPASRRTDCEHGRVDAVELQARRNRRRRVIMV